MNATTWKRAKQVFHEALEKSGSDRKGFVATACRDDRELRAQVQALLAAHDEAGEFMASLTVPEANETTRVAATVTASPPSERPGATIGHYKLLQVIGEGGFGVVYMAEQEEPVRRRVALKIIKLGMDTKQVIARFEAERQALALMEHPNIARVFDAGATETGRPYFVMELVKGVPITEYCDSNRLSTRERLDLFTEVCGAVQHAHQKGIVHRDIKPSNVMVTLHDGKPVPKVIDFGIAKATSQRLTEKTLFTEYGQFIGTPVYMSPEQAEMSGLDVDTRSDIYSLGVLLYELLTGTTPFDVESLRAAGFAEIQRMIREDEPPKPSTRLSTLGGALTNIAKHRKTDPSGLSRLVRGDLDWIVMKALEKDRTRRFASASEFAADVARHLGDEPVTARPPSTTYLVRKFVTKHKRPVAAAAVVVLTALIFGSVALWQRQQAVHQRNVAEEQRREAEWRSYVGNIAGAEASLRLDAVDDARQLLQSCPPELRGWEWTYLWSRTDMSIATITQPGHRNSAYALAFSPDGERIASGSRDSAIRIWDAATGALLATFDGHDAEVRAVAFSPDGTRIASGSTDSTIRLWDATTGEPLATLRGHEDEVRAVAFSPDGRRIASASYDHTVRLWGLASGELLATLIGHEDKVKSVAFSPDGTRIVSGSDGQTARVWDAATGESLLTISDRGVVNRVAFSPDGTRIAAGGWTRIRLFDAATGELLDTFDGHTSYMWGLAFSPEGSRIVSGSYDETVRVWDTASGEQLARFALTGIGPYVSAVAFSPDGTRIASGSNDGTIRLWDAATSDMPTKLPLPDLDLSTRTWSVAFSPDGSRIASGSSDGRVRLWDTASGELLVRTAEREGHEFSVAFSPDGRQVASGSLGDGAVRLWDAVTGELLGMLSGHGTLIMSVAFSPDGTRIATGCWDRTIRLWDAATSELLKTLTGHEEGVQTVTYSPDGTRIASGSYDGTVRLWNAATGELLNTLAGHEKIVQSVAFSPDGRRIASASSDRTIRLWDAATGETLATYTGHENEISSVAFSPDGTRIASGSDDRTVRLWDTVTGLRLATLPLPRVEDYVYSVAFSPDGTRIAAGTHDDAVRVWADTPHPWGGSHSTDGTQTAAFWGGFLAEQGAYGLAAPFLRRALELRRRNPSDEDWRVADAMSRLGGSLAGQGKLGEAEPLLIDGLESLLATTDAPPEPRCAALARLLEMRAESSRNRPGALEQWVTKVTAGRGTPVKLRVARMLLECATRDAGYVDSALGLALEVQESLGDTDLRTLETVAEAYLRKDKMEEALDAQRRALSLASEAAPLERARVEGALLWLEALVARKYAENNRLDKAVEVLQRGLEDRRRALGANHRSTLVTLNRLGSLFRWQEEPEQAAESYAGALEARRRVQGDDDPNTLISMRRLADFLTEQKRFAEAEPLHREALERTRRTGGPINTSLLGLGRSLNGLERYAEAELLLREHLERLGAVLGLPGDPVRTSKSALGESLVGQEKFEEAERLLLELFESDRKAASIEQIVRLYESWGRTDQAAEWRGKLPLEGKGE